MLRLTHDDIVNERVDLAYDRASADSTNRQVAIFISDINNKEYCWSRKDIADIFYHGYC